MSLSGNQSAPFGDHKRKCLSCGAIVDHPDRVTIGAAYVEYHSCGGVLQDVKPFVPDPNYNKDDHIWEAG